MLIKPAKKNYLNITKNAFFSMEFSKNKCKQVKCLKKLSKCSIFSFR